MLEQRLEGMSQHLVGTVADKHVGRGQAVVIRHRLLQGHAGGVRIQAQGVGHLLLQRR